MPVITGELHYRAKLSDAQVLAIRRDYRPGVVTLQKLADRYGVTRQAVSQIVNGKARRHVTSASHKTVQEGEEVPA